MGVREGQPGVSGRTSSIDVVPSFSRLTAVVARSLALTPQELMARFVPAAARELEGVVALRRVVSGDRPAGDADADYLRWRYHFGNPGRGRGDCWVLVLEGSVVAMIGTEKIRLRRDATEIHAWSTMDIAVHPRCEGVGLGGWMNLRICQEAGCALTIGSNRNSRSMLSRTFHALPNRRSYVHFLRFDRIVAKRIRPVPLAKGLAASARVVGSGVRALAFLGSSGAFQVRRIERFDSSVSTLIERAAGPGEIWIARTVEFLNWRLFDNPRMNTVVFGAYASAELVGFLAIRCVDSGEAGRRLLLVDWMIARERFAAVLRILCARAFREAVGAAAESVTVTAYHRPSERLFRRWGFLPQPNPYETMAINATDRATLERLMEPAEWFVTEANTDRDAA